MRAFGRLFVARGHFARELRFGQQHAAGKPHRDDLAARIAREARRFAVARMAPRFGDAAAAAARGLTHFCRRVIDFVRWYNA